MINSGKLAGKTLFITGASRGIGKAIALKAAKDGANVVIAAKTAEPHPKLPGTIYTAAKEIEDAGGKCFPCVVDVREEEQVQKAVDGAVSQFGGIDILVNNASAINLSGTTETPMKRYDLMNNINTRGTFLVSKLCIPHLKNAQNPHILNLSPPLIMNPRWFKDHVAYTMAKYGMSMCVLGMAEELKPCGIAVNALWPKTAILTAAMEMLGGKDVSRSCRKPEIVADAAYAILTKDSKTFTGNFCIDEKVLAAEGVSDLDQYAVEPGAELLTDFFLSDEDLQGSKLIGSSPETSTAAGGTDGKETAHVFEMINGIVSDSLVKTIGASYVFTVKEGDSEQPWHIDLKEGNGSAGQGEPPSGKADVVFKTDKETFLKIFDGSIKPTSAFMSGKLKMKGDMGKAMKLDKLMGKLKSKL